MAAWPFGTSMVCHSRESTVRGTEDQMCTGWKPYWVHYQGTQIIPAIQQGRTSYFDEVIWGWVSISTVRGQHQPWISGCWIRACAGVLNLNLTVLKGAESSRSAHCAWHREDWQRSSDWTPFPSYSWCRDFLSGELTPHQQERDLSAVSNYGKKSIIFMLRKTL